MNTKLYRQVGAILTHPVQLMGRSTRWLWQLQARERLRLADEMHAIKGLMPLLMKQRNGYRWTRDDLQQIKQQLRTLLLLCPYLALLLAPGGLLILPLLAWWLDRRRGKRSLVADSANSNKSAPCPLDAQGGEGS